MINSIVTGVIILLVIEGFSFYIGTLIGSNNQAAKDQKIVDQYDRLVNDKELRIKRLELKLKSKEKENG